MQLENFLMAAFAGIMATYGLLTMAMWADQIGLPRLDFTRAMANLTYGKTFGAEGKETPYWPGMVVIFMNGIFFALLYGSVVGHYIPLEPPVLKGAVWGLILWFLSGAFYVPVYLKEGFMLSGIHKHAWITSLLVHVIWGLFVGWISPIF